MYKLIALDLDGTLTDSNKEISDATKDLLIQLAASGVHIVLASGRPTPGLFKEAQTLKLNEVGGYLLSYNGAHIVNYQTGEVIYNQTLPCDAAHALYDQAKAFGLSCMTYNDSEIITEDAGDYWVHLESYTTKMPIHHVRSFKEAVQTPVNKLLMTGEDAYVASVIDEFKAPFENKLSIYRSSGFFVECMAEGIDKALSLKRLCETLGVKQEETIAFGDGYNDLSMIEWCHTGVAMGNAVDELKQRADAITTSNDDQGVYVYLKDLVDKGQI